MLVRIITLPKIVIEMIVDLENGDDEKRNDCPGDFPKALAKLCCGQGHFIQVWGVRHAGYNSSAILSRKSIAVFKKATRQRED